MQANKPTFVTVKGQQLLLDNKPFHSVGVNRYNLLTQDTNGNYIGCGSSFTDGQISTLFSQLHNLRVTTVRFWLFQSFTKSSEDTTRFDYILDQANQNNIKVIPVLENRWEDCTQGGKKDASWYASGYKSPYGSYPLSLDDYIKKIVPLYKNDPTILSWEIINEASDNNTQALYNFTTNLSQEIKSLDPHHLVSISINNNNPSVTEKLGQITTIDFLTYHDYTKDTEALPEQLQKIMNIAKQINKPIIIGESGIHKTVPHRDRLFADKMRAFFQNGGAGYLIWSYGDTYITDDGYNFTSSDPVAHVVKQTAEELNKE
ncbi:MAG: cellulase family glycosylhydrolase [Candidatus Levyibacteriota bacterium]